MNKEVFAAIHKLKKGVPGVEQRVPEQVGDDYEADSDEEGSEM